MSSSLNGLTLTVNSIVFVSSGSNSTFIPLFKSCSVYSFSPNTTFPSNVVPVGIVSFIIALPVPFPLLVAFNLYVIVSISFNGIAETSLVFSVLIFTTLFSTSVVSLSATFAVFFIDSVASLFTITSKLTDVSCPAITLKSFHSSVTVFLPSTSDSVFTVSLSIELSTSVVPSGIVSMILVIPSTADLLFAVIVYLIFCPALTVSSFFNSVTFSSSTKLATLLDSITGVLVLFVSLPFTIALFSIKSKESVTTFALKEKLIVSPALISFSQTILPFWIVPSLFIEFSTNSVPSGIES